MAKSVWSKFWGTVGNIIDVVDKTAYDINESTVVVSNNVEIFVSDSNRKLKKSKLKVIDKEEKDKIKMLKKYKDNPKMVEKIEELYK